MSFRKEISLGRRERASEDSPLDQLAEGYEAMASDQAREAEALEWSEATIGDVIP